MFRSGLCCLYVWLELFSSDFQCDFGRIVNDVPFGATSVISRNGTYCLLVGRRPAAGRSLTFGGEKCEVSGGHGILPEPAAVSPAPVCAE